MTKRSLTCGSCGKKGHNRRTCGTVTAKYTKKLPPPQPPINNPTIPATGTFLTPATPDTPIPHATPPHTTPPHAEEHYTAEDLLTLWKLLHPEQPTFTTADIYAYETFLTSVVHVTPPSTLAKFLLHQYTHIPWTYTANETEPRHQIVDIFLRTCPPHTRTEAFTTLIEGTPPVTHTRIALFYGTPPDVLAYLTQKTDPATHLALASRTDTPPDALTRLADSPFAQVRHTVAKNPSAPPAAIRFLLTHHGTPTMKETLAANPATPPQILDVLVHHPHVRVRAGVARNPAATPAHLATLSTDTYHEVRINVANNPASQVGS